MLKLRVIPTALLGAFGLLAAAGAQAVTPTTQVGSVTLGSLSAPVTGTVSGLSNSDASFQEYLNFSIGSSTGVTAAVTSLNLSSILGISGLTANLYSGTASTLNADASLTSLGTLTNGTLSASLSPNANYNLLVTGSATGGAGGSFAYAIAPVPEPAESTLMAVGFGLVGFIAVTKRQRA